MAAAPQAVNLSLIAAGGAAVVAAFMLNKTRSPIVKALSGQAPPELDERQNIQLYNEAANGRMQRRPSWAAKFEAPEVPKEDVNRLKKSVDEAANSRMQRRPSWAAKFEAPEVSKEDVNRLKKSVDEAANSRMQRRPSWAAKFEAPEVPKESATQQPLQKPVDAPAKRRPPDAGGGAHSNNFATRTTSTSIRVQLHEVPFAPWEKVPFSELDREEKKTLIEQAQMSISG